MLTDAQRAMVLRAMPTAKNAVHRWGYAHDYKDALQIAALGLTELVRRFDPGSGWKWEVWAYFKLANYLTIKRKKARPLPPRAEPPGEALAIVELNRLISNTPLTAQDRVALRTFFTDEPIYAAAFFRGISPQSMTNRRRQVTDKLRRVAEEGPPRGRPRGKRKPLRATSPEPEVAFSFSGYRCPSCFR
ncbi:MAG: hypothetical protein ACRBN8_33465 [Nannocystales bacterium]